MTEDSSGCHCSTRSEKRVRFGRSVAYSRQLDQLEAQESISKQELWYNKDELHSQFFRDLEQHDGANSRGLEYECNQRRKLQAEAYVRAVVEKSDELRKSGGHLRKSVLSKKTKIRPTVAHSLAETIHDYASQLTWMTRDLALGVASMDEAEARSIYEENEDREDSVSVIDAGSNCAKACPTGNERQTSGSLRRQPVTMTAKSA
ncbi:expressed unknown protein [Seminavis robusta]|uniref:Uncharacterized protein n=1 Tax=Seminavis robusta TaxID=568900 RepID=A0A9N8EKA2_9STRA|nr:expressed unknown protein [Seminavis robusta]|eukprot:Sro1215_g253240.1 n/a (204) ;mRNA; r:30053-30664